MAIDTKSITHNIMFWLLIAFIAGFGFSEVLTRAGINPLRSSAFAPSSNTLYCGPGGNAAAMGYVCGNPFGNPRQTYTDVNGYDSDYGTITDDDGSVISGGEDPGSNGR